MANLAWLWFPMLVTPVSGKAVLDLTGELVVNGTWKGAVTLPCVYEPSAGFKELSVIWKAFEHGHGVRNIVIRDKSSGDQILVTTFKSRLKVNKQPPGDVSLQLNELVMTDSGPYTCQVLWEARNKSRIGKEMTTTLQVVKVPVSKPTIQSSHKEAVLAKGSRASLTCSANGSPPIQYQWYKEIPGDVPEYVRSGAELAFDQLQASDAGRYYCLVSNRVGRQTEKSDIVELRVDEDVPPPLATKHPRKNFQPRATTERGPMMTEQTFKARVTTSTAVPQRITTQKGPGAASSTTEVHGNHLGRKGKEQNTAMRFPLYLIILIVVLCVVVLLVVVSVIFCRRRTKTDSTTFEVAYHNNAMNVTAGASTPASPGLCEASTPASPGPCECACKYQQAKPGGSIDNSYTEEPTKSNVYMAMETEYECLVNQMESEYEIAGIN